MSTPSPESIEAFAENLRHEIVAEAHRSEDGAMLPEAFTEYAIDAMTDTGDWPEGQACYHRQRGAEVSGWGWDDESGTINLAVTRYSGTGEVTRLAKSEATASLRRLRHFFELCIGGLHKTLEESSPTFDLAYRIARSADRIAHVRLFLLTDMVTSMGSKEIEPIGELNTSSHVWDLERLHRLFSSGREREKIDIDLLSFYGEGLPFLEAPSDDPDLRSYLMVMPGKLLADLYSEYGARLLELNVRSYLQARGKVNKGIRQTIISEPERIFAYNNGISATASAIKVASDEEGRQTITAIEDLQIVNGGQTTASIATVHTRDKQPVDQVAVQAKLTVVPSDEVAEIVPLISRYANSQNAVSEADLTANHPFHVQLEKLSRSVWAPAPDGAGNTESRWFYERARGQYQDALARERTPARKRDFKRVHPTNQRFTKTDVAKFENTWLQKPDLVSRGAQKSFVEFMLSFEGREVALPEVEYFQQLCAKAIMYRSTEKIVAKQNFGGYRANIVVYTLSYINLHSKNRIDLGAIWRSQSIGVGLDATIEHTSHAAFDVITSPPGGQNITEWCKKEDCWRRLRGLELDLSKLDGELIGQAVDSEELSIATALVKELTASDWRAMAVWIDQERLVPGRYRTLSLSLERAVRKSRNLTPNQHEAGAELVRLALAGGFVVGAAE